jgi:hypothetical protein
MQVERGAAGDQQLHAGRRVQQLAKQRRAGQQVLEVVEYQQLLSGRHQPAECFGRRRAGLGHASERVQHGVRDASGIGERGEVDECRAVWELAC